jgi:hypothetical protein
MCVCVYMYIYMHIYVYMYMCMCVCNKFAVFKAGICHLVYLATKNVIINSF